MIIKKLELQGFKSFPERTKIVFHPGITAVVGPNGTGKSNIVDAILWTLGGQRSKSLRGERTEDIIFNGNTKTPPLGMAEVTLTLGNANEEMTISHRVFRSGESEYRLDGKAARLKDIQEALWKKVIGEKDYFVIEQGSIGLLITSKPSEKRALLEEAAGTAFFKDKKKQTQTKLETSEQNLVRLEDIINEVERSKNSLQRQAQAAARYRKLREKIRELKSWSFCRKIVHLERSQKEAASQLEVLMEKERNFAFCLQGEEKDFHSQRQALWELEKIFKTCQENAYALKNQLARLESEKEKETKRIEYLIESQNKAQAEVEELEKELAIFEKEINASEKDLQILKENHDKKKGLFEETKVSHILSQEKILQATKALDEFRAEHFAKLSELTSAKNEEGKIEKELELLLRQQEKLKKSLEEAEILLQEKEKMLQRNRHLLELILEEKEKRENNLAELRKFREKIKAAIETLNQSLSEGKGKKEKAVSDLQALKKVEEKLLARSESSPSDLTRGWGLLASHIEPEPQTASLIDVFWKEEAKATLIMAEELLKYISQEDIRGNFLLLSAEKKDFIPEELLSSPAVLGFLKSRIKASENLEKYFTSLPDAVIVKDIACAIELWLRFPQLNFITEKGDLLLSSGLLKLGQKEEGIFSLSQEIRKVEESLSLFEKEILPLEKELEEKLREDQKIEEVLEKEKELLASLEKKQVEVEKDLFLEELEVEKISQALSHHRQELQFLGKELSVLKEKKGVLAQSIASLQVEEEEKKKNIEEKETELMLLQRMDSEEERKFYDLKASLSLIEEKIRSSREQIRKLRERKDTCQGKLQTLRLLLEEAQREEGKLKEELNEMGLRLKKLEEEKAQKEALVAQKEMELSGLKKDIEEREARIKNIQKELETVKEERMRWEIKKAEVERDIVNLEESCWQELKKTLQEVKEEIPKEAQIPGDIESELEEAEENLQKYKAVNLMAEEEYQAQKSRYEFLIQQRNDLRESITSTNEALRRIDEESKLQFLTALEEVNKNFQEVFSLLFKGGVAEIKLVNPDDPFESGVEITAQPPGKKVANLALLSGGEKSLTSLAFLFALFRHKPTPFCIFDEVDAALDDVNLARFLELLKAMKTNTQFIIITHNYKTMEVADYIYGTTMVEPNITRLYSVKIERKEEKPGDLFS